MKKTDCSSAIWKEGKFFIGLVQIYCGKSVTALKMSGPSFYPLHICLPNVSDKTRRKLIVSDNISIGYISCKFDTETHENNDDAYLSAVNDRISHEEHIELLHNDIDMVVSLLFYTPYVESYCKNVSDKAISLQLMLSSYLCNTSKGKESTSVNQDNATDRSCFCCYVPTNRLKGVSQWSMHRATHTLRALGIDQSNPSLKVIDTIRKQFGERSTAEGRSPHYDNLRCSGCSNRSLHLQKSFMINLSLPPTFLHYDYFLTFATMKHVVLKNTRTTTTIPQTEDRLA